MTNGRGNKEITPEAPPTSSLACSGLGCSSVVASGKAPSMAAQWGRRRKSTRSPWDLRFVNGWGSRGFRVADQDIFAKTKVDELDKIISVVSQWIIYHAFPAWRRHRGGRKWERKRGSSLCGPGSRIPWLNWVMDDPYKEWDHPAKL